MATCMSLYVVRHAIAGDVDSILAIPPDGAGGTGLSRDSLDQLMTAAPNLALVLLRESKVVGFACASIVGHGQAALLRAWVTSVGFKSEISDQKIRMATITALLNELENEGAAQVSVTGVSETYLQDYLDLKFTHSQPPSPTIEDVTVAGTLSRPLRRRVSRAEVLSEIGTSESLTSLLTAGTFVLLAGVLASQRANLQLPAFSLVVAAVGFLFGALIYGNGSGELARLGVGQHADLRSVTRLLETGNIVSEYFGVYFLAYAIPPTAYLIEGPMLGFLALGVTLVGFIAYHASHFSVLERYFSPEGSRRFFYLTVGTIAALVSLATFFSGQADWHGLGNWPVVVTT